MNRSDDDDPRTLLGAWALDAVDDLERAKVERAIAGDEELAAEARELRETVSQLAEADSEQPPAQLRESVLAEIRRTGSTAAAADADAGGTAPGTEDTSTEDTASEETASEEADLSGPASQSTLTQRGRWWTMAAAAAFIGALAIPTWVAIGQADRANEAEQLAGISQEQADQMYTALMDPEAQMVAEDMPDGSRAVAILGEGSAVFAAHGMTELHQQDYQLWMLDGDEAISAGVLTWEDGQLSANLEDVPAEAALAVTAEPIGGSEQPTTDPLVVLAGS